METLEPNTGTEPEKEVRYYSEVQVSAAATLGGPLAGGWLLAKNEERRGQLSASKQVLLISVAGLLALVAVSMFLPTDFPNSIGPLVTGAAFLGWYRYSFRQDYDRHIEADGQRESGWKVVGTVVAATPISLVAAAALSVLLPIQPMNYLPVGENFVYYEGDANRQDAERLAWYLEERGVLQGIGGWEIGIEMPTSSPNAVIVKAPMATPPEISEEYLFIQQLVTAIQADLYPGKEVSFHVLNEFGFFSMEIDGR